MIGIAAEAGFNADELRAGLNEAAIKDKVKAEVEASVARGVFGSPYLVVDGEPFWGMDRFDMVDRWLAKGGW